MNAHARPRRLPQPNVATFAPTPDFKCETDILGTDQEFAEAFFSFDIDEGAFALLCVRLGGLYINRDAVVLATSEASVRALENGAAEDPAAPDIPSSWPTYAQDVRDTWEAAQ